MKYPLAWAEVDLGAIAHNVRKIRQLVSDETEIMVMVKANGYGHGAVEVANTVLQNGATRLGTADIEEGIELRHAGINAPILVIGYTSASMIDQILRYDLTPSICSLQNALELATAVTKLGRTLEVHLQIDTGMGRLGILHGDLRVSKQERVKSEIMRIIQTPGLVLKGIFTHFATADEADKAFAWCQLNRFLDLTDQIEMHEDFRPMRHIANSAASIEMPESHLDMIRTGISVYGLSPSKAMNCNYLNLRPALSLKARIIDVKSIAAGTPVSYGCTYISPKATRIATIPVGYRDGYCRSLSNQGFMLVRGKKAPIVGVVCMELTMIDVGCIPDVKIGDEVVLMGKQGAAQITTDDIASLLNTINDEIITTVMIKVPRKFIH